MPLLFDKKAFLFYGYNPKETHLSKHNRKYTFFEVYNTCFKYRVRFEFISFEDVKTYDKTKYGSITDPVNEYKER
ncbi:hypothetical protein [Galbibacter pacificus]|uniref:Uncharacterized protein n=1 Tax=Galbibacter pacificus TaxID=2996052 RepID=A0ABT6FN11_9FLAO|nr:hypothetical protein [Galbibacter pacificus]MDG3581176.1 hypothetical protein [Galbibacter pacificus]MDG3584654.1 hypothetical protein [Galbibacter pacificus]